MSTGTDFIPLSLCVLTVSDSRTLAQDASGDWLAAALADAGHRLHDRALLPDDRYQLRAQVSRWIADEAVDGILVNGGTGFTGRDSTPEAVRPLFDKTIDGFGVVFHLVSYQTVGLSTLQSRATAGIIDGVFVFCLPGSNGAVKDGWDKVIAAQLDSRHRPCNMVELMPRLLEA